MLDTDNLPAPYKEVRVTFTPEGYESAKQYSNPWLRAKLWYNAFFRHHPFIVVIAVILTAVIVEIIHLIVDRLTNGTSQEITTIKAQ